MDLIIFFGGVILGSFFGWQYNQAKWYDTYWTASPKKCGDHYFILKRVDLE